MNFGISNIDPVWQAISRTPGVGVGLIDMEGGLYFLNETTKLIFFGTVDVDYAGKSLADFFVEEFVGERLELFRRVVKENRPFRFTHILFGRPIESILWPIKDPEPAFDRVLVVSRTAPKNSICEEVSDDLETVESKFIDLGNLDILSKRELEVFALLGQGMSVPRVATTLHRSPKTIERHKSAIATKLSLKGQSEIIYLATSLGIDVSDTHRIRLQDARLEPRINSIALNVSAGSVALA